MPGINKERRSSNNKENTDSSLLENIKARIEGKTEMDFEITEQKIKKYQERRKEKTVIDGRLKGLIECPACKKVYNKLQWGMHKWKELHKTQVSKKPIFKNKDKVYKCVLDGCEWNGSKCHTHFKTHLINHGYQALLQSPIPVEVRL